MSDTEFDHDAEANEYHIAVKQQLYADIAALQARVRELEADPRLAVSVEDWWRIIGGANTRANRIARGRAEAAFAAARTAAAKEVTHGDDG